MAERKSFTITWRIKNFSFCWQKREEELCGPTFSIERVEGSKWTLVLFPHATRSKETGTIDFYFYHEIEENGPQEVEIDYELSALGVDGLPLKTVSFTKCKMQGNEWSAPLLLEKNMVFLEKQNEFLPKDSLTVRCRIWQINQENINGERYFATTRVEIEKALLFGVVRREKDWTIQEQRYHVEFISVSTKTPPIFIYVRVTDRRPFAEIQPAIYLDMKFCKCELRFIDHAGNEIAYGQDEFLSHFDTTPILGYIHVWKFPLNAISECDDSQPYPEMENMTLRSEVTYSIGITSQKFEKVDYSVSTFRNGSRLVNEKYLKNLPSLKDDMFSLMTNTASCDIQLKTKNKTFPAHSIILSARSLFFRNKLNQKNKEKTIYFAEMDNETLYQMLVFLYTDTIENLESKNAMDLYIASKQYGIPSLKHRCSFFLQNNIDGSICCNALQLADQCQDGDLKKVALNYILEHADEVIGSEKWQDLERFTELTEEVLCLKRNNS